VSPNTQNIIGRFSSIREGGAIGERGEYNNLERLVQKHEAEIRNHIRTEQQLRLYIENLETEEHIKMAQIENLNEKVEKLQRENKELKEVLDAHKRELSIVCTKRQRKTDKIGKGSLPQVKKALTNSQGSIKEFVRYLRKNKTGGGGSVSSTRGELAPELNETDDTASLTMRKPKQHILDSDHKKDNSQILNGISDKLAVIFRRKYMSNLAKHSSKGSLSQPGFANLSATARAQSGRTKPRKTIVAAGATQKPKKKLPIFERKDKFDLSKIQKTSTKKSSIASNTKVKKVKEKHL
jgi:hypothetical protein